jgi:hypothetical protein
VNHSTTVTKKALNESTLLDYIRFQANQHPPPAAASINRRVAVADRALQLVFPRLRLRSCAAFAMLIGALCRSAPEGRARR